MICNFVFVNFQDSPKEDIPLNAVDIPKDFAESPVKHAEVEKKPDPAPVEKPKSPVQEIVPPVKHAEESKDEGGDKINDVVPEAKKPEPINDQHADKEIPKEVPKDPVGLSPKIVKKEENVPVVDSRAKGDGAAPQPGIQQGSPLKEQHVDKLENPPNGVPVADSSQKGGPQKGDNTADEKVS